MDNTKVKKVIKYWIQAGAGGVGSMAIQMAKHLGAYVATTAKVKKNEAICKRVRC